MTTIKAISQWLLAILMIFAGVMHFVSPSFFLKIMLPSLPLHLELVYLSGAFEIALGVCLDHREHQSVQRMVQELRPIL